MSFVFVFVFCIFCLFCFCFVLVFFSFLLCYKHVYPRTTHLNDIRTGKLFLFLSFFYCISFSFTYSAYMYVCARVSVCVELLHECVSSRSDSLYEWRFTLFIKGPLDRFVHYRKDTWCKAIGLYWNDLKSLWLSLLMHAFIRERFLSRWILKSCYAFIKSR